MMQFLIAVDPHEQAINSLDPIDSELCWRNDSEQVGVWIWKRRCLSISTEGLNFTVGHSSSNLGRDCPYVNVRIDRYGRGKIEQDPLGLHPLYMGVNRDATFLSNDPHRIAEALSLVRGSSVSKCLSLSAYLVSGERPIGFKTGFEGIECTPYATRLEIDSTHGVEYFSQPPLWSSDWDVLDRREVDSVIEFCATEMAERLRTWVENAQRKPTLPLTGGYDSRLVLALAIEAGILHSVNVVTRGNVEHPDVLTAAELTKRLRVDHNIAASKPSSDILRNHVHRTAGMVSLRLGSAPKADAPLLLHGLLGETFRSNVRTQTPIQSREELIGCWMQPQAYSGLLKREAQITALTEGIDLLLAPLNERVRPELGLDIFYVQHLARRWISSRPEYFSHMAFPLYCSTAVRLALQMGWAARRSAFIHETVIGRVGGALIDVPYMAGKEPRSVPTFSQLGIDIGASKESDPKSIATSWYDNTLASRSPRTRTVKVALSSETEKEVETLKKEYKEYVEETSQCRIWDAVDRHKVRQAVDLLPILDERARQDLDAAISGILWHST